MGGQEEANAFATPTAALVVHGIGGLVLFL